MVLLVHRELQHYDTQTYRLTRQGAAPPERELALQRSKPFGAAVAGVTADERCVTLLMVRDAAGLASYVVTPSGVGANHVVNALASAVGATATPIETLPDLDATPEIGWLEARPDGSGSRDTQAGGDQRQVAILLSRIMRPESWVAMTLRQPTRTEVKRVRWWFGHRLHDPQTHYTNDGDAVVASIMAGADSHEEVASLLAQLAAVIPGFDVETTVPKPFFGPSPRVIARLTVVALVAIGTATHHWADSLIAAAAAMVAGTIVRLAPTHSRHIAMNVRSVLRVFGSRHCGSSSTTRRSSKKPPPSSHRVVRCGRVPTSATWASQSLARRIEKKAETCRDVAARGAGQRGCDRRGPVRGHPSRRCRPCG